MIVARMHRGALLRVPMALAVCGALLAGCAVFPVERELTPPPLVFPEKKALAVKVRRDTIIFRIGFEGVVRAVREEALPFPVSSVVSQVPARTGPVSQGDVLVQLVDADLQAQLRAVGYDVRRAELRLAEFDQDPARGGAANPPAHVRTQRRLLELDLEQLLDRQRELERLLRLTTVRAPFDGLVTSIIDARPGQPVQEGSVAATVADPSERVIVLTDATGGKLRWLQTGLAARVSAANRRGGAQIEARVAEVRLVAEDVPDAGQPVRLKLDTQLPEEFQLGTPVSVQIEVARAEDVLVVPSQAVRRRGEQTFVVLRDGESTTEVLVTTGLTDGLQTEIVEGLEEGQQVLIES